MQGHIHDTHIREIREITSRWSVNPKDMIREIREIRVQKKHPHGKIRVYPCLSVSIRVPKYINHQTKSSMKIRSYSKQELAMLYFPDSDPRIATNHLMRWINRNQSLLRELKATGYYSHSKFFTTRQVCAILDYLGDP